MAVRAILDTDIGTDVDDCLALSLILNSPEFELEGVTCVYGDVRLRSRMVLKLLELHGTSDVPVCTGAERPLLGLKPVYWAGHEGVGLLESGDERLTPSSEHAVDFIVRTVWENPGEIHLIAVGPLTNMALAFLRAPDLAGKLAHLTIMGGAIRGPGKLDLPYAEHNISCDPEAAHVVFASGAPITLVPLDVTTEVRVRADGVSRIRAAGSSFNEAVARQIEMYPPFARRGFTLLHDPLAATVAIRPDLVSLESLHVDVELQSRNVVGATFMLAPTDSATANAQVATTVRAQEFERFFLDALSRVS